MSDSNFIGEIRAFAANYAPAGWLLCDGTVYQQRQYLALYAIIGNSFGGSAQGGTFGVPDLRGKAAVGVGAGASPSVAFVRQYAQSYGHKNVQLNNNNIPYHNHTLQRISAKYAQKTSAPSATSEFGNLEDSDVSIASLFVPDTNPANSTLSTSTIGTYGSQTPQAVNNIPPYSAMYFAICWDGVWPPKP